MAFMGAGGSLPDFFSSYCREVEADLKESITLLLRQAPLKEAACFLIQHAYQERRNAEKDC